MSGENEMVNKVNMTIRRVLFDHVWVWTME